MDPVVVQAPEQDRYELRLGGELVGFLDYRRRDDRIVFLHTEVEPDKQGRGYASFLIESALKDARSQDLMVVPICPFVARFIEEHPEYAKLLPAA